MKTNKTKKEPPPPTPPDTRSASALLAGEGSTTSPIADNRAYPARPFLAVSAAIIGHGRILLVRRARPPADGLFSLPGGLVETGETLVEAIKREVAEETGLSIEPVALAGFREAIMHDKDRRVERHFVILSFVSRWRSGELFLNNELSEARWVTREELAHLPTTDGLAEIVEAAFGRLEQAS